ncbi:radical SAM protein [bacterium]|nr:radical SAM protein [candidate division CSSED10-310 bacterium]
MTGMKRILLIYPPHARNTEPPLGSGLLAADLKSTGVSVRILDLNAEAAPGLALNMKDNPQPRVHRAFLHIGNVLEQLRSPAIYAQTARYRTAVGHYAGALRSISAGSPWTITPGDFTDTRWPVFNSDTVRAVLNEPEQCPFHDFMTEKIYQVMDGFNPDLTGISVIYRTQFLPGLSLAGILRERHSRSDIVMGGGFFKCLYPDVLRLLKTEGIGAAPDRGEPYLRERLSLPGSEKVVFHDPDYTDIDFSRYFAPGPVVPVTSALGCYWGKCRFCAEKAAFVPDDPDGFKNRLIRLGSAYGPELFHLTDNAIPVNILKLLASWMPPAPWYGFVRMTVELTDFNFVRRLADNGCRMLQVGLESVSKPILSRMEKGVDSDLYPKILDNLIRAGIRIYAYVLFGYPGETDADRTATLKFLADHPVDFLNASIFRFPGRFVTASDPGRPELRKWLSETFYSHPVIRKIAFRTPRYYKSSHAAVLRERRVS